MRSAAAIYFAVVMGFCVAERGKARGKVLLSPLSSCVILVLLN